MFGFCYGFSRICKCLGTSFFGGIGVVVTLHIDISPPPSLPRRITHPDLPQGKEQVTLPIVISPHLTSPEGEGQIVLVRLKQVDKQDSA